MMKPSIDSDSNESAGSIVWSRCGTSCGRAEMLSLVRLSWIAGYCGGFFSPTTFRAEALLAPAETATVEWVL